MTLCRESAVLFPVPTGVTTDASRKRELTLLTFYGWLISLRVLLGCDVHVSVSFLLNNT